MSAKLAADLQQKENVVNAQAEEASQWRDKVRRAESAAEKLASSFADKENELLKMKTQIEAKKNEISTKDMELRQVQDEFNKVIAVLEPNKGKNYILRICR